MSLDLGLFRYPLSTVQQLHAESSILAKAREIVAGVKLPTFELAFA
jgi:hypothetical protein